MGGAENCGGGPAFARIQAEGGANLWDGTAETGGAGRGVVVTQLGIVRDGSAGLDFARYTRRGGSSETGTGSNERCFSFGPRSVGVFWAARSSWSAAKSFAGGGKARVSLEIFAVGDFSCLRDVRCGTTPRPKRDTSSSSRREIEDHISESATGSSSVVDSVVQEKVLGPGEGREADRSGVVLLLGGIIHSPRPRSVDGCGDDFG